MLNFEEYPVLHLVQHGTRIKVYLVTALCVVTPTCDALRRVDAERPI